MGQGFCTIHTCGEFDDSQFQTTEPAPKIKAPLSPDIERLSQQDFVDLSKSENDSKSEQQGRDAIYPQDNMMEENKYEEKEEDEEEENGYYKLHDHQDIPFAKEDDFYSIPAEDPSKSSNSKTRNSKKNKGKGGITLAAISEENSLKHTTTQQLKPSSEDRARNIAQLKALKAKYSSRRVILPGKDKKKTPRCFDCEGFYHIQSDPINAYDGVGIICELCGKNRQDNPELLLEEHYYKCEDCENVDICTKCYHNEQRKLAQKEE